MHSVNNKLHFVQFKKEYLQDIEKILTGYTDIFSENDLKQCRKDLLDYTNNIAPYDKDTTVLVFLVDSVVCGIIFFHKDIYSHNAYRIEWLAVAKDQQNKGYGTHLMQEAFKHIRKNGGKHVYLETSNERHNEHAKKFYEDLGFKKVGVLPDYYDPPIKFPRKLEDGIIYHKAL